MPQLENLETNQNLIGLLDYVEQVVRLDEHVALRLADYRLPDKTTFTLPEAELRNLPGIRQNSTDGEGPIWLQVERLKRQPPPRPPDEILEWTAVSADPAKRPEPIAERIVTVTEFERDEAIASGAVRPDDVSEAPKKRGEEDAAPRFDLRLHLVDRPDTQAAIDKWTAEVWARWSLEELPRRKTIAIYQKLYKILQVVEVSGGDRSIELIWGIGGTNWKKGAKFLDRPFIECRVDIEIDDAQGGSIRIRPTEGDAVVDLKPYEEFGCEGLHLLSDLVRDAVRRASDNDGISPFIKDSFEPILFAAATRLDPEGIYAPDDEPLQASRTQTDDKRLSISDSWVLFARPRSQHIVLQDLERLRQAAEQATEQLKGVAARLVTEPSTERTGDRENWEHRGSHTGIPSGEHRPSQIPFTEVFFPKPYNDDQIEIVRRLARSDGLVVQGPPGTGKTHTIANLICHAMAVGQRVLVVSRGEAALSVLRDQLPEEVRPLAISILSNERQGLHQVEGAIRRVQEIVDAVMPESRSAGIRRREAEISQLRQRIDAIDTELDQIAGAHLSKLGPRNETPVELALRVVAEREAHAWFVDRPSLFVQETSLSNDQIEALRKARIDVGGFIDHLEARLPISSELPQANIVASWHIDLIRASELGVAVSGGPLQIRVGPSDCEAAEEAGSVLDAFAKILPNLKNSAWLLPFFKGRLLGKEGPWDLILKDRLLEQQAIDEEYAKLAVTAVALPLGLLDDEDARAAVARSAAGQRQWSLTDIAKGKSKALVRDIKLNGGLIKPDDFEAWKHVAARIAYVNRCREADARWDAFAKDVGAPRDTGAHGAIHLARRALAIASALQAAKKTIEKIAPQFPSFDPLLNDPALVVSIAQQIKSAVASSRLEEARSRARSILSKFDGSADRTSRVAQQLLREALGRENIPPESISSIWSGVLDSIARISSLGGQFGIVRVVTAAVENAGASLWAQQLRSQPYEPGEVDVVRASWRDAWDYAAAEMLLDKIDARHRLITLSKQRNDADTALRRLFGEMVRERTFLALEQRLSPAIKTALVEFVRALARIGKGTGKGAGVHRRSARDAMSRCYEAVPCWIMPTWRVAEQLPATLGAFDLVILDEASQSDVTELPALLRGKKVLIVGDDRQVSPTAPFVTQAKVQQLRHHYLNGLPFKDLFAPGESLYDLMRAVFPNDRLMLKEHFRCVEPIIRFSMRFYNEALVPLRVPTASERIDPPLIDIFVPHGRRDGHRKINPAEADVIVGEIDKIAKNPAFAKRSIGVISLIGAEQAELIRTLLSERIGEEKMQRHSILCGDSSTFQGNERDIVFLSMVADPLKRTALTMLRYEQRFNVAVSRARDQLVLVRSIRREELNGDDLKARLIAHFENPMPAVAKPNGDIFTLCGSDFERDVMRRLLEKQYNVTPQVGSVGFSIDMVVEGADGTRLAIECDGDRFHGPAQWRDDMRRQRILERVGWRFWRCFASNYYRDPDTTIGELVETLTSLGIDPIKERSAADFGNRYVEHRTAEPPSNTTELAGELESMNDNRVNDAQAVVQAGLGDKVILHLKDEKKILAVKLTETEDDQDRGLLSMASPLGRAVKGAQEGDEINVTLADGIERKIFVETITSAA